MQQNIRPFQLNLASKLLTLMLLALTACTQERPASFPDGEGENVFKRSQFEAARLSILTASSDEGKTRSLNPLHVGKELRQVKVAAVEGPNAFKSMFKGLWIQGEPGRTYPVQFKLNHRFLTAYKIVDDASGLSVQEAELSHTSQDGKVWVPIFQYPVETYGVLARVKNDLDEETHTLKLDETEWPQATHVRISTLSADRVDVALAPANRDQEEITFTRKSLNNSVMSAAELRERLGVHVASSDQAHYQLKLNGNQLSLFEITTLDQLPESDREALRAEGSSSRTDLRRCGEEVQPSSSHCVLVHRYDVAVHYVKVERRPVDFDGTLSAEVRYTAVKDTQSARLLQIARGTIPTEVRPSNGESTGLDPLRTLLVDEVKNQEYLFRRTLQDSPLGFDYAFPGLSGNLEIVRFQFEKDRVRIVRSKPLVDRRATTSVDVETLMSLPAKYFRRINTDSRGVKLATPRYVPARHDERDAIAYVDWSRNEIPNVASPLNYYTLEQCFIGPQTREISEVDQRMKDGMLSFSVSTTYASDPSVDCAGLRYAGYFESVQMNFTFKERISFKKYESDLKSPLGEIPYEAQKLLGFGLFTYEKQIPNSYGNTGSKEAHVPLPAIFDLQKGRQIEYVLAGLPSEPETRSSIIQATQEVIDDWNAAFSQALLGTALERKDGKYLKLFVEGDDIEPRKLGDLDRNYIYYVQKAIGGGLLGLGGSHSNPRTGEVEAGSVFIYGGNILSSIESVRKAAQAKAQYKAIMSFGQSGGSSSKSLPAAIGMNDVPNLKPRVQDLAKLKVVPDMKDTVQEAMGFREALGSQLTSPSLSETQSPGKLKGALALRNAVLEGIRDGGAKDRAIIEAHVNEKLLKFLPNELDPETRQLIRAKARQQKSVSELLSRMRSHGLCVYQDGGLELSADPKSLEDLTDLELVTRMYKPILAHELGHNLGLRHNFMGSFDRDNFKFDKEDETDRKYSSIMDYLENYHEVYDGIGPQDVAAIRAAYAGLLEIHPDVVAQLPETNGKKVLPMHSGEAIPLVQNRYLRSSDYLRAIGLTSWKEVNIGNLARLPLKNYHFCSDEDLGESPICNVFDRGTTPVEIVQAMIEDYRAYYSLRNFVNDRETFSRWNVGGYISRIASTFLPIRQFLQEAVFQAIKKAPPEVTQSFFQAAFEGMMFFHEVIRTPDAPAFAAGTQRFVQIRLPNGTVAVVERKALSDIGSGVNSHELSVRGIEFDKLLALLFLTERGVTSSRYAQENIRISYPELESMVIEHESKLELPTIGLLTEVLRDQVSPAARIAQLGGGPILLGPQFEVNTTEMLRYYALLGSIMSLDVEGLETTENLSGLFRVMSDFSAPSGAVHILQAGANAKSKSSLRYWPADGAEAAAVLIDEIQTIRQLKEIEKPLGDQIVKWVLKSQAALTEAETSKTNEMQTLEAEINSRLAKFSKSSGPSTMADLGSFLTGTISRAKQLLAVREKLPPYQLRQAEFNFRTYTTQMGKRWPIIAFAMDHLPFKELGMDGAAEYFPSRQLDVRYALTFNSAQTLNELFYLIHPEYAR